MKKIFLHLAQFSGKEQKYIQDAFDTNWVTSLGPNVTGFEEDLSQFLSPQNGNKKEIVALSSGTAAIHLSLLACGVKPGDEVICQSLTFCASANPIIYTGANPVFVDSEESTWNMDPWWLLEEAIEQRYNMRRKLPKAIIVTALYGMPYDVAGIFKVADKYGIPVIEDTAEALGSKVNGQYLGTFGKFGILSFNGNKLITTSGGGAIICENKETKEQLIKLATQAKENAPYYHHTEIGYNYRLSNVCAGIGRGQMEDINEIINHHRYIAKLYKEKFSSIDGIEFHDSPSDNMIPNYWLCNILLDEKLTIDGKTGIYSDFEPNENVKSLCEWLNWTGIECRPLWKPLHTQPIFRNYLSFTDGAAESLFKRGVCLPNGLAINEPEVDFIVQTIKSLIK